MRIVTLILLWCDLNELVMSKLYTKCPLKHVKSLCVIKSLYPCLHACFFLTTDYIIIIAQRSHVTIFIQAHAQVLLIIIIYL